MPKIITPYNNKKLFKKTKPKFISKLKEGQTIEGALLNSGIDFSFSKVSKKGKTKRALVYNPFAKEIVSNNPGIIKDFLTIFNNKSLTKIKGSNNNYSFERIFFREKNPNFSKIRDFGVLTKEAFILKVLVEGKSKKFFIKRAELSYDLNNNNYGEYFGLMIQKIFGLNIVEPQLAYIDLRNNIKTGFLVSEYSDLMSLKKARKLGIISNKKYSDLFDKILKIQDNINRELPEIKLEINNHNLKLTDMLPRNIFLDTKTGKLVFYDPWLIENNVYTKIGLFFQKRFLKLKNKARQYL